MCTRGLRPTATPEPCDDDPGHTFSDKLQYVFTSTAARFSAYQRYNVHRVPFCAANAAKCKLGKVDSASGDPTDQVASRGATAFRMYAALRDDPFYNNVKGLLGAYQTASSA